MLRRSSIAALVLMVVAWLCAGSAAAYQGHVPGGGKRDLKRQVEDLEEQWRVAQLNADTGLMDKLLSDDYVGISMTGQVNTKSQQLDRLRARTLSLTRIDLSDVKVKLVGKLAAIVTSRADVVGSTADGVPMTGEYLYTRVYQRLPNGMWKITNFEATRVPQERRGPKLPVPANSGQ